jgi:soluble lytic murein transglycosylase
VFVLDGLIGRASGAAECGANVRAGGSRGNGPPRSRIVCHVLLWLIAAIMVAVSVDAVASSRHKPAPPHRAKGTHQAAASHHKVRSARREKKQTPEARPASPRAPAPARASPAVDLATLPADFRAARQAIDLMRQGKSAEATVVEQSIGDPVVHTLVEWVLLRHADSEARFDRYAAFIRDNPDWPGIPLLRRRAEGRLWQERRAGATVRDFLGGAPSGPLGRLALARALIGEGDRAAAERELRETWWSAELSAGLEAEVLDTFRDVLTRADHRVRMDWRLSAKDFAGAMRAARRLGDDEVAIVKACAGAEANSNKVGAPLDAVSSEARQDIGYTLCQIRWLRRHDDVAGAAKLMLAAPRRAQQPQDADEWWRERRALARKLLDLGEAETAYRIVREAIAPANVFYHAEFYFMAGWIALRFLGDPAAALAHFAHVDEGSANPIVLARAAYWRGRAAEAAGRPKEMRASYEAAAGYPTAYYGQLARAKLGLSTIELRPPPSEQAQGVALELLRAVDIIYAIGERDFVVPFVADLAEHSNDDAALAALAQLTARHDDARATLIIGKTALGRGLALDRYAFPDIGVPPYSPIGPDLDRCVVYSVVRTESAFDQRDLSPAKAVGLMQVTPEAGRDTAKRFGVRYDWTRLVSDPVYNTQMGAAELAALLREYRGSYLMAFAAYNAGRGRVDKWVAQYGDPRDPTVDAVDWVERIPFAETRNYVQRVMENLQIYRVRIGDNAQVMTEPN